MILSSPRLLASSAALPPQPPRHFIDHIDHIQYTRLFSRLHLYSIMMNPMPQRVQRPGGLRRSAGQWTSEPRSKRQGLGLGGGGARRQGSGRQRARAEGRRQLCSCAATRAQHDNHCIDVCTGNFVFYWAADCRRGGMGQWKGDMVTVPGKRAGPCAVIEPGSASHSELALALVRLEALDNAVLEVELGRRVAAVS